MLGAYCPKTDLARIYFAHFMKLGVEMASTGEVACFGKDEYEAFYTAIQSVNNFRLPHRGDGVLVGYDDLTAESNLNTVLQLLSKAGLKVFVTGEGSAQPSALAERVAPFPSDDRIYAGELFTTKNIGMVIQLARRRPKTRDNASYLLRRMV